MTVFSSIDGIILQCLGQTDKGTTLSAIIGFVDYINHTIITYDELLSALTKLVSAGLVLQDGNDFKTSPIYDDWHKKKFKKRPSMNKEYQEIMKFLSTIEVFQNKSIVLSKEKFDEIVQVYLNR